MENTSRPPLRRSTSDRMLTGTAAGIARYLNVDPLVVRIGFAVSVVFGGLGMFAYLAAFLLLPEEGSDESIASDILGSFEHKGSQS
jgi:phage shock protein PspC (stress-responsive transcriptional regulator)